MTSPSLVRGRIVFKSSRPELTGATVYVRLEDVSRAAASAHIVSEQIIETPAEHVSADGIPFALSSNQSDIDSQRRYSVALHIDMDGNGEMSVGDYIRTFCSKRTGLGVKGPKTSYTDRKGGSL